MSLQIRLILALALTLTVAHGLAAREPIPSGPEAPTSAAHAESSLELWRKLIIDPARPAEPTAEWPAEEAFLEGVCKYRAGHRDAPTPAMLDDASILLVRFDDQWRLVGNAHVAVHRAWVLEHLPRRAPDNPLRPALVKVTGLAEAERLRMASALAQENERRARPESEFRGPRLGSAKQLTDEAEAAWAAVFSQMPGNADSRFRYQLLRAALGPEAKAAIDTAAPAPLIEQARLLDPWLGEMLAGELCASRALIARRTTPPAVRQAKPGEPGSEKPNPCRHEAVKAAEHFRKALEVAPRRPEGAAAMIRLVAVESGAELGTAREWFDRAVRIEMDFAEAYRDYIAYIGGSRIRRQGEAVVLARDCLDTQRFDTRVPFYASEAIDSPVHESRAVKTTWKEAGVYAEVRNGLLSHTLQEGTALAEMARSRALAIAICAEKLDDAKRDLVGGFSPLVAIIREWVDDPERALTDLRGYRPPLEPAEARPIPAGPTARTSSDQVAIDLKGWEALVLTAQVLKLAPDSPERRFAESYCRYRAGHPEAPSMRMLASQGADLLRSLQGPRGRTSKAPSWVLVLQASVLFDTGARAEAQDMAESVERGVQGWFRAECLRLSAGPGNRGSPTALGALEAYATLADSGDPAIADSRFLFSVLRGAVGERLALAIDLNRPNLITRIVQKDRWLAEMLLGECRASRAWLARGHDWASNVKDESWEQFRREMLVAREHYLTALELQPDRPEPAIAMIGVTLHDSLLPEAGTARQWFDGAVAIELSSEATGPYLNSLRPRWGGSHEQMVRFAQECVATGRFDTNLPMAALAAARLIGKDESDPPAAWRVEGLYDTVMMALKGGGMARRNHAVAIAYAVGKWDEARALMSEPGWELIPAVALEWTSDPELMIATLKSGAAPNKAAGKRAIPAAKTAPTAGAFRQQLLAFLREHYVEPLKAPPKGNDQPVDAAVIDLIDAACLARAGGPDAPLVAQVAPGVQEISLRGMPSAVGLMKGWVLQGAGDLAGAGIAFHALRSADRIPWLRLDSATGIRAAEIAGVELPTYVKAPEMHRVLKNALPGAGSAPSARIAYVFFGPAVRVSQDAQATTALIEAARDDQSPLDPWLAEMLLADARLAEARVIARGRAASGLPALDRSRHQQALGLAKRGYIKAAQLQPSWPEAVTQLIVLSGELSEGSEQARSWFDQAVAIEMDYLPAYEALRDALGADTDALAGLVVECVNTERYDTMVPAFALSLVKTIDMREGHESAWSHDRIYGRVYAMLKRYAQEGPPQTRAYWLNTIVAIAAPTGRWQHARIAINTPGFDLAPEAVAEWMPREHTFADRVRGDFGERIRKPTTAQGLADETMLRTSPAARLVEQGDGAFEDDHAEAALEFYMRATQAPGMDEARTARALQNRIVLAETQSNFGSGEETRLLFRSELPGWNIASGRIERVDDSTAQISGSSLLMGSTLPVDRRIRLAFDLDLSDLQRYSSAKIEIRLAPPPISDDAKGKPLLTIRAAGGIAQAHGKQIKFGPATKLAIVIEFFEGRYRVGINGAWMETSLPAPKPKPQDEDADDPEEPMLLCFSASNVREPVVLSNVTIRKLGAWPEPPAGERSPAIPAEPATPANKPGR